LNGPRRLTRLFDQRAVRLPAEHVHQPRLTVVRHVEEGVGHAERPEDMTGEVRLERLAGH
jgi:hypothetical protein